jgi:hypothetical protein
MKRRTRPPGGLLLTAVVTLLSILSAVLLFVTGIEAGSASHGLDSRVTCEKLGPKACEPNVAAVPDATTLRS